MPNKPWRSWEQPGVVHPRRSLTIPRVPSCSYAHAQLHPIKQVEPAKWVRISEKHYIYLILFSHLTLFRKAHNPQAGQIIHFSYLPSHLPKMRKKELQHSPRPVEGSKENHLLPLVVHLEYCRPERIVLAPPLPTSIQVCSLHRL